MPRQARESDGTRDTPSESLVNPITLTSFPLTPLIFRDGAKLAAVVSGGNIWTSTDSGATWTEDTSVGGTKGWNSITSSNDGTKLAAVVYYGNIWTTRYDV